MGSKGMLPIVSQFCDESFCYRRLIQVTEHHPGHSWEDLWGIHSKKDASK